MTNLTQKLSKQFFGPAMRVVTLALFLAVFGASAALAQTRAYVTNVFDDTVSVIDPANDTVIATVMVGDEPTGLAVTPNGAFVYVAKFDTNFIEGAVSVIDTSTNTLADTVSSVGFLPGGIAITPDGAFAYVKDVFGDLVSVISIANNTVVDTVTAGPNFGGGGIAITPNGAFAYVGDNPDINSDNNTITVIDTSNNTVVDTVLLVDSDPLGIAITPNGAFAYVVNGSTNSVSVISTAGNALTDTITVGNGPSQIAFGVSDPLQSLIAQIQALVVAGTLTQNQGARLIDKINQVIAKLDAGQTSAACNQLNAFISQVNAFINNHSLTPSQGQPLIDGANAIRASNGCP